MGTTSLKRSKHAEVPCSPGCRGPRRGYVCEGPVDFVQGLPREEVLREGEHPQVQHLECQQVPPSSTTAVASSATLSASTDSSTTVSSLLAMTMAPTGSSRTPGVAAGERVATSG